MAIGTTAAIIGSAVIGAGASYLGSKSQSKAASQAAAASDAAAQAQLQLGRESLALNKDIYNANFGLLSPYVSRGNVAGNQINALLGLPNAPAMTSPIAQSSGSYSAAAQPSLASEWTQMQGLLGNHIDGDFDRAALAWIQANAGRLPENYSGPTVAQALANPQNTSLLQQIGGAIAAAPPPTPTPTPAATPTPTATPAATTSPQSAKKAFEQFANSAGMQFQLDTAYDAINNGYAGAGALQSGAAMKAISDRSQDIALNNYFLPYMGLLSGQQGVGASSGAAIAGVGSNFGNTAAGINANMGGAIGNNAANQGNLALAQGQNQANMWSNLGSSFGNMLGKFA